MDPTKIFQKTTYRMMNNIPHDEEEYGNNGYNTNKSASANNNKNKNTLEQNNNQNTNAINNATPLDTVIISAKSQQVLKKGAQDKCATAKRVLKEGAQDKRVHSKRANTWHKQHTAHRERYRRRVHKPGGGSNIMIIGAVPGELSYTPTIVAV